MLLVDMTNTDQAKANTDMESKGDASVSPSNFNSRALVELKNGKVMFRQKALSCEKMSETMQEIVKFRNFLKDRATDNCPALQSIPDEYTALIAQLTHESDKTLQSLARHIQKALRPEELESSNDNLASTSPVTQSAVESAIISVADRLNYGVDWTEKVSAALSIWKWEVKRDKLDLLPKAARDKFEARITEREEAKRYLRFLFDGLPQSEKDLLYKAGRKLKNDGAHTNANDENKDSSVKLGASALDTGTSVAVEEFSESNKESGKPRKDKSIESERAAKEKEKADKKAAKEERERKAQEAQTKSRSIMSAFFKKPKAINSLPSSSGKASAQSPLKSDPSSSKSDFEKTFKPFVVKKDAALAPINHFKQRERRNEVIVIDEDTADSLRKTGRALNLREDITDPQEILSDFIANASPKLPRIQYNHQSAFKSSSTFCVRDIFSRLSEADVLGDTAAVRNLHDILISRTKIPAKILLFHEDTRPGYFGTFTKSSTVIGPRTPFTKDAVTFDYSYDSGEDWEEEEEGADDVMSNDGEEVAELSEVGSDLDDWLVDDDVDVDPGTPLSERAVTPDLAFPLVLEQSKRKTSKADERREPKKRRVMPLVPFTKGPCWENSIGTCVYEPFKQYRIKLFNDTPFPIDPFTFVSSPITLGRTVHPESKPITLAPSHVPASCSGKAPDTQDNTSIRPDTLSSAPLDTVDTPVAGVKRKPAATLLPPKHPFPEALLPYLADKIEMLASGNMIWLVESLYQDLKAHKIKKNAIDAKVREVCEKCPKRRVWVVREEVLTTLGKAPAPSAT